MNTKTALSSKKTIEFREVSFRINDILKRLIVLGVSLEIPQGETLVLLGRSGSGKTTLLKLINGMLLPSPPALLAHAPSTPAPDPTPLRPPLAYLIHDARLLPPSTTP